MVNDVLPYRVTSVLLRGRDFYFFLTVIVFTCARRTSSDIAKAESRDGGRLRRAMTSPRALVFQHASQTISVGPFASFSQYLSSDQRQAHSYKAIAPSEGRITARPEAFALSSTALCNHLRSMATLLYCSIIVHIYRWPPYV